MKQIIILIFILLLTACGHNIPTATLTFTKIEKDTDAEGYFNLYFSSDIALLGSLSEKHTGAKITCFNISENIKQTHFINYKGYVLQSVNNLQLQSKTSTYNYLVNVFFTKSEDYDGSKTLGEIETQQQLDIIKLLNTKPTCLNCVVTAASYLDIPRRYISNTMCLPKEALKKVID